MAKASNWSKWAGILGCSGIAGLFGLLFVVPIFLPIGQCLIDLDDEYDSVVYATIHYFQYAVVAFLLACCAVGGLIGRALAKAEQPEAPGGQT